MYCFLNIFVVSLLLCDGKLNIFGVWIETSSWSFGNTVDIFHHFTTFHGPNS